MGKFFKSMEGDRAFLREGAMRAWLPELAAELWERSVDWVSEAS